MRSISFILEESVRIAVVLKSYFKLRKKGFLFLQGHMLYSMWPCVLVKFSVVPFPDQEAVLFSLLILASTERI